MFAEQTLCKSRFFKLQDEPVVFVIMKITLRKIIPVPFLFPFEREELAFLFFGFPFLLCSFSGSDWNRLDQIRTKWIRFEQIGTDWIRLDQIGSETLLLYLFHFCFLLRERNSPSPFFGFGKGRVFRLKTMIFDCQLCCSLISDQR